MELVCVRGVSIVRLQDEKNKRCRGVKSVRGVERVWAQIVEFINISANKV